MTYLPLKYCAFSEQHDYTDVSSDTHNKKYWKWQEMEHLVVHQSIANKHNAMSGEYASRARTSRNCVQILGAWG